LAGGTQKPKDLPNPAPDWLSERSWGDILTLAALDKFSDFAVDFPKHHEKFKEIFDSADPQRFVASLCSYFLNLRLFAIYFCSSFRQQYVLLCADVPLRNYSLIRQQIDSNTGLV